MTWGWDEVQSPSSPVTSTPRNSGRAQAPQRRRLRRGTGRGGGEGGVGLKRLTDPNKRDVGINLLFFCGRIMIKVVASLGPKESQ